MRLDHRPKLSPPMRAFEQAAKQLLTARGHQRFDTSGDLRRRVFGELEIVLKIPADALAFLRREFEGDVAAELQRRKMWNIGCSDLDPIAMRCIATLLRNPQDRHEIYPRNTKFFAKYLPAVEVWGRRCQAIVANGAVISGSAGMAALHALQENYPRRQRTKLRFRLPPLTDIVAAPCDRHPYNNTYRQIPWKRTNSGKRSKIKGSAF
jgi:hypothetical protein